MSPALARSAIAGLGTDLRTDTSTWPRLAIVSRFERSSGEGCSGHGVSTTARTARPAARAACSVSSVWLIVPRPGRAAIRTSNPSATARSRTVKSSAQRHQQAPDPLHDQRVPARPWSRLLEARLIQCVGLIQRAGLGVRARLRLTRPARPGDHLGWVDPRTLELRREVGRHRWAKSQRRDVLGSHAGRGRQQLVIGGPRSGRLVQAGHDRLVRDDALAGVHHRGEQSCAHDRLAGARVGTCYEQPAHVRARATRLSGRARDRVFLALEVERCAGA